MANQEHVDLLKQGVEVWNQWRGEFPNIHPDLSGVHLTETTLDRTNLDGVNFKGSSPLRHLMQLQAPAARAVRVLGIDDFAWKKRFSYGTILVDLERRKIIEILADRESSNVEKWLREHHTVNSFVGDKSLTLVVEAI
jgi:hypothetical protein